MKSVTPDTRAHGKKIKQEEATASNSYNTQQHNQTNKTADNQRNVSVDDKNIENISDPAGHVRQYKPNKNTSKCLHITIQQTMNRISTQQNKKHTR
jgi:hypothetical protein